MQSPLKSVYSTETPESSGSSSDWSPSPLPPVETPSNETVSTPDRFMGAAVVPSTRLPPLRRLATQQQQRFNNR